MEGGAMSVLLVVAFLSLGLKRPSWASLVAQMVKNLRKWTEIHTQREVQES